MWLLFTFQPLGPGQSFFLFGNEAGRQACCRYLGDELLPALPSAYSSWMVGRLSQSYPGQGEGSW